MSRFWKAVLFRLGLVLLPLALLGLGEGMLRVFYPGPNLDFVIPDPERPGYVLLNPEVGRRYFPISSMTGFGQDRSFPRQKAPGTFRIITLGGSTTAGFPYFYSGSFPSLLETRLKLQYPDQNIEIINAGLTAVNSYTVRDLLPDCLALDPDLLVIYCGHNEFYGAFGSASTVGLPDWLKGQRSLTLAVLALHRLRLYQVIQELVSPENRTTDPRPLMTRMYHQSPIDQNSTLFRRTITAFQKNMDDVLTRSAAASVPVILATVTSNIAEQPPLEPVSPRLHSHPDWTRIQNALAHKQWQEALDLLSPLREAMPGNPHLAYAVGEALWHSGDTTRAVRAFLEARDLDGIRFRAPSEINAVLRQFRSREGTYLADVDSFFFGFPPSRLPEPSPFLEHVHFTMEGNATLARQIASRLPDIPSVRFKLSVPQAKTDIPDSTVIHWAGLTALDQTVARIQIQILTSNPPFTSAPGLTLADFRPHSKVEEVALKMLAGQSSYRQGHWALAEYWQSQGKAEAAVAECRALVNQYPDDIPVWKAWVAASMKTSRTDRTLALLAELSQRAPDDPFVQKWYGIYALNSGQTDRARLWLTRAKQSRDDDQIRYNLAGTYLRLGQWEQALAELDTLLKRNPRYPRAQDLRTAIQSARRSSE